MLKSLATRLLAAALFATSTSAAVFAPLPAFAANSTSLGHGVKCYWVLVSSIGGTNTYKQVCRKGV